MNWTDEQIKNQLKTMDQNIQQTKDSISNLEKMGADKGLIASSKMLLDSQIKSKETWMRENNISSSRGIGSSKDKPSGN